MKPLLGKGVLGKKLLLTIILLSRTLVPREGEVLKPNYSTITNPGPAKRYTVPRGIIRKFVKHYNLSHSKPEFKASNVYLSTKGSPSGKASLSAPKGILALSYTQMQ